MQLQISEEAYVSRVDPLCIGIAHHFQITMDYSTCLPNRLLIVMKFMMRNPSVVVKSHQTMQPYLLASEPQIPTDQP